MKRKLLVFVGAVMLSLSLAACGSTAAEKAEKEAAQQAKEAKDANKEVKDGAKDAVEENKEALDAAKKAGAEKVEEKMDAVKDKVGEKIDDAKALGLSFTMPQGYTAMENGPDMTSYSMPETNTIEDKLIVVTNIPGFDEAGIETVKKNIVENNVEYISKLVDPAGLVKNIKVEKVEISGIPSARVEGDTMVDGKDIKTIIYVIPEIDGVKIVKASGSAKNMEQLAKDVQTMVENVIIQ